MGGLGSLGGMCAVTEAVRAEELSLPHLLKKFCSQQTLSQELRSNTIVTEQTMLSACNNFRSFTLNQTIKLYAIIQLTLEHIHVTFEGKAK